MGPFGQLMMAPVRAVGRAVFGPGRRPLRELGAGIRSAFATAPGSAIMAPERGRTMRREAFGGGGARRLEAEGGRPEGEKAAAPRRMAAAPAAASAPALAPAAAAAQRMSRSPVTAEQLAGFLGPNLAPYAEEFVLAGQRYGLDPRFLASISKLETANGTSTAFRNKNNAMGISNSKGPIRLDSVEDSIDRMARTLAREDGPYAGKKTIREIGAVYAPPGAGNDPYGTNEYWPRGVSQFFEEMGGDPEDEIRLGPEPQRPRQARMDMFLIDPIQ